ncbi:SAM-dependent methyltransferase [Streptomyces acidiscabies]|uniref:SAM-dependent methyltransferase n=1 Tax=Streptomyces acidiscabies TaxID=42234 RepID=UPI0038F7ECD6
MSDTTPPYIDPTKPGVARVYDAFLGGTDNHEVDREVVRGVRRAAPEAADLAVGNRAFLDPEDEDSATARQWEHMAHATGRGATPHRRGRRA